MRAVGQRIRAHLTLNPGLKVTAELRQLLGELDFPDGRYPTPADIARHLPPALVASVFEGFAWEGV